MQFMRLQTDVSQKCLPVVGLSCAGEAVALLRFSSLPAGIAEDLRRFSAVDFSLVLLALSYKDILS